ncbi:unnamed protein product [Ceratitis capitata]|uniref:(Mediterranean fruit fly) hypothetical protein n=1 Tax=Ceratitis capitata TaxID=7213 RepID=A0A811U3C9_CERCA|nr:unnamed protein product [Ceratitis capitata]
MQHHTKMAHLSQNLERKKNNLDIHIISAAVPSLYVTCFQQLRMCTSASAPTRHTYTVTQLFTQPGSQFARSAAPAERDHFAPQPKYGIRFIYHLSAKLKFCRLPAQCA